MSKKRNTLPIKGETEASAQTTAGERLRALRMAAGYTQQQAIDALGALRPTLKTYRSWEQGKTTPDVPQLCALADLYGVSCDYLLVRSDYKAIDGAALADITGLTDEALRVLQRCAHDPRLMVCPTVSAMLDEYAHAHTGGHGGGVLGWLGSYAALSPDVPIADADAGIAVPVFLPRSADRNMLAYTFNELQKAANQFRQDYGAELSPETNGQADKTVSD